MGRLSLVAAIVVATLAVAGPARAVCTAQMKALAGLLSGTDLSQTEAAVASIGAAPECAPADARKARMQLAEKYLAEAKRLSADPAQKAVAATLIEKAAALDVYWVAAMSLGDAQLNRKDYVH